MFSIFIDGSQETKRYSSIKFGSYDQLGIKDGEHLQVFKTPSLDNWHLTAGKIEMNDYLVTKSKPNILTYRNVSFELAVPYLYVPDYDFDEVVNYTLHKYKDEGYQCDTEKCWFDQNCDDVDLKGLDIKVQFFFHHIGSNDTIIIDENVLKIKGSKIGMTDS